MSSPRVTLRDVAERCGFSVSAVSHALRNTGQVSKETRRVVTEVALELGYRPDPALSALASHRNQHRVLPEYGVIPLLVPKEAEDECHPWQGLCHAGMKGRSAALGYRVEMEPLPRELQDQERLGRALKSRGIEGILIGAFTASDYAITLEWDGFAAVSACLGLVAPAFHKVSADHAAGLKLALQRVSALGYKSAGYCHTDEEQSYGSERVLASYLSAQILNDAPLTLSPPLNFEPSNGGLSQVRNWLSRHGPEVILASWSERSPHWSILRRAIHGLNPDLADAVLLVSLNIDDRSGEFPGIHQNAFEIGAGAVDLLHEMMCTGIRGVPAVQRTLMFSGAWVPGIPSHTGIETH